jgi:CTP:molybdopterin cytidylyltransferase MocA
VVTAALVLAGGESRRFGRPKQLADLGGKPLLAHVVEQVHGWSQMDAVYVVLGAAAEQVMETVDLGEVPVIENLEWREGIGSSLRVGLDFLIGERSVDQALLVLGDQPNIPGDVVPRLLEARRRSRRPVIIPRYRFTRGHPVLVHRSLWPALITGLSGDQGARNLFLAHPEWVEEVLVEARPPGDVDTPEDLRRIDTS